MSKKRGPRFAYPCIGGPLDGQYATTEDMIPTRIASRDVTEFESKKILWKKGDIISEGGMFGHLADEYHEFNSANGRSSKRIGSFPSMIFVHKSLIKPLISPKER